MTANTHLAPSMCQAQSWLLYICYFKQPNKKPLQVSYYDTIFTAEENMF